MVKIMRTTRKEICEIGASIATILNTKNNTNDYYFDDARGVVKCHNNVLDVIVWAQHTDYKTYSKLIAIRDVLCELN